MTEFSFLGELSLSDLIIIILSYQTLLLENLGRPVEAVLCSVGKPWVLETQRFQQDNSRIGQEWFDVHDKKFNLLPWPPNSSDLHLIEHLWDVLNQQIKSMEASPLNLQDLKDLLLMAWCQISQNILDASELFLEHKGDIHDIRQVLMLLLININGIFIHQRLNLISLFFLSF